MQQLHKHRILYHFKLKKKSKTDFTSKKYTKLKKNIINYLSKVKNSVVILIVCMFLSFKVPKKYSYHLTKNVHQMLK